MIQIAPVTEYAFIILIDTFLNIIISEKNETGMTKIRPIDINNAPQNVIPHNNDDVNIKSKKHGNNIAWMNGQNNSRLATPIAD